MLCAAHSGWAARAAATCADASPIAPDHSSAPVAGSKDLSSVAMLRASVKTGGKRSSRVHSLSHAADGRDLGFERRPVVAIGDGGPDSLDLLDVHRAGLLVAPIGMPAGRSIVVDL